MEAVAGARHAMSQHGPLESPNVAENRRVATRCHEKSEDVDRVRDDRPPTPSLFDEGGPRKPWSFLEKPTLQTSAA